MQRTFNYTGRARITQAEAMFALCEAQPGVPNFDVSFQLERKAYPQHARLYVEAYYKETRQRFDFGNVHNIVPPVKRSLHELDLSGTVRFRVLVVDESERHSLILASGDGFVGKSADDDKNRAGLLVVKAADLGALVWRLDFDDGFAPELLINKQIPNAIDRIRRDPLFQALILPTALHQIMTRLFFESDADPDSEPYRQWLAVAMQFHDEEPAQYMDVQERDRWMEDVTEGFANHFELASRLIEKLGDED